MQEKKQEEKKYLIPSKDEVIKDRKIGRLKGYLERSQRIAFNVFIQTAYKDLFTDPVQEKFSINTKEFCLKLGIDHRNIFKDTPTNKSLRTILMILQSKLLIWEYKNERGNIYKSISVPMLSYIEIDHSEVKFSFSNFFKGKILTNGNAYILKLPVLVSLRSTHSIALYEQIIQRKDFEVWHVNFEDFRGLMGIEPNEYKKFSELRRNVINTAVDELNEKLHLNLTFAKVINTEINLRKVVGLTFTWDKDALEKSNHIDESDPDLVELQMLNSFIKSHNEQSQQASQPESVKGPEVSPEITELANYFPENLRKDSINQIQTWLKQYKFDDIRDAVLCAVDQKPNNFFAYIIKILQTLPASLTEFRAKYHQESLAKEKEDQEIKQKAEQELLEEKQILEDFWWDETCTQKKAVMPFDGLQALEEKAGASLKEDDPNFGVLPQDNFQKKLQRTKLEHKINLILKKQLQDSGIKPPESIEELKAFQKTIPKSEAEKPKQSSREELDQKVNKRFVSLTEEEHQEYKNKVIAKLGVSSIPDIPDKVLDGVIKSIIEEEIKKNIQ